MVLLFLGLFIAYHVLLIVRDLVFENVIQGIVDSIDFTATDLLLIIGLLIAILLTLALIKSVEGQLCDILVIFSFNNQNLDSQIDGSLIIHLECLGS